MLYKKLTLNAISWLNIPMLYKLLWSNYRQKLCWWWPSNRQKRTFILWSLLVLFTSIDHHGILFSAVSENYVNFIKINWKFNKINLFQYKKRTQINLLDFLSLHMQTHISIKKMLTKDFYLKTAVNYFKTVQPKKGDS